MKKLTAFVLFFALLVFTNANASEDSSRHDLSSLSEQQLVDLLIDVRSELLKYYAYDNEDALLLNVCDVTVTFKGYDVEQWGTDETRTHLSLIVENKSELPITITFRDISINGWMAENADVEIVAAGKSAKTEAVIWNTQSTAYVKEYADVEDIEFVIGLTSNGVDTLYKSDPITLRF